MPTHIEGKVRAESAKALCIECSYRTIMNEYTKTSGIWFPKSLLSDFDLNERTQVIRFEVPTWVAVEKSQDILDFESWD